MRKVITAATVAVVLVIAGHAHTGGSSHAATGIRAAAAATTTRAPTTSAPEATVAAIKPVPHAVTTSTVKAQVTTTTSHVANVAALRARALQMCLELAATNNYRVVAANNGWYAKQLHALEARGKKSSNAFNVLLVEQSQTRDLIDAQFTIDQSNCYIKYA